MKYIKQQKLGQNRQTMKKGGYFKGNIMTDLDKTFLKESESSKNSLVRIDKQ